MRLYIYCFLMKSAHYKFKSSIKKHRNNICMYSVFENDILLDTRRMAFIVARRYPDVPFFASSLLFNQLRTRLTANYTEDDEDI